ncbi:hypothetical protein TNCV_2415851 [Trichonephila clavipes]|nr:hypothetical protein TNCV_2415851 [Trichonephila clavipes]
MTSLPSISPTPLDASGRPLQWHLTNPNPEREVGSNFRVSFELSFSGTENVIEFLDSFDNISYYEIPANLACAYLKSHLVRKAQDWFELIDYEEVRNPTTKVQLLQLVEKYEERHGYRGILGSTNNVGGQEWDSRRWLPDRRGDGNWRDAGVVNRQTDAKRMNVDSNVFRYRGVAGNQGFEHNRISNDRGDHRSDSRRGRNDSAYRGSSNAWNRGDRRNPGNLNF